ncbi:family 16 glycosylhydrolase [Oryzifoliimicrobium ureilyticus]|uniref:family 16 glycosylhydrolase n=1 Tax=Oryzifoliimicrobium ureilyticus TaxID=3113724 RepID=UPI00307677EA
MRQQILNALGTPLYYSDTSTAWFSATKAGSVLNGSSGNDSMYGDSAVNVTMQGGAGDDIYYLYSSINRAVEAPGAGIDTINTWMSYTLPANFENLTVTGDGRYAFGNSQDNIITGGSGSQTIDGGAGNDVLTGGGGADTFIFTRGNGTDLITDFSSDDKVRLNGYSYSSFEQVLSHTTQQGANLKLDLGGGEAIVFANTKASDLQASQFQLALDRSHLTTTFDDEFNSLSLRSGTTGTWDAKFSWAPDSGGTLHTNGELQWYINPSYAPTSAVNPFSVSNGVLSITAAPASASIQPEINNYKYTSGLLTTHSSFAQTYGYFEMRAQMPHDQGVWPAFWLLPEDGKWPPELDVVEMRGQEPNVVNVTAHSNDGGSHTLQSFPVKVPSTDGFHNYGVLWDANNITWYFDDVAIAQAATPSDMHSDMYMVVNLAVGGTAGTPANGLAGGSTMKIDYIKAYSLASSPVTADSHTTVQKVISSDWHI